MEATILCNKYHCGSECDEHFYCNDHFTEILEAEFERGKKEGYEKGKQDAA